MVEVSGGLRVQSLFRTNPGEERVGSRDGTQTVEARCRNVLPPQSVLF